MRNYRFSLNSEDRLDQASGSIIIGNPDLIHQISKVLRLSPGHKEEISFIDGSGIVFYSKLSSLDKSKIEFQIIQSEKSKRELKSQVKFFIPIIKNDAFEFMLRKLTELGVQEFYPVIFERSQKTNIDKLSSANYYSRLNKIIQEATEQCEGAIFAKLHPIIEFNEIQKIISPNSTKIFASERLADTDSFANPSTHNSSIFNLLIGPEGGLNDQEASLLEEWGFIPYSLGKRLLKAETAAIVLASKIVIT